MIGLKDVAQYAGVSASTVSRVLTGKGYVNDRTRKRVMEAARVLDYRPNLLAQGLKMGISNTIALMIPSIQNLIFPDITRGVEDAARRAGYTVVLCNTDEDVEIEKHYINNLRTRLIDGFIVASMVPGTNHIQKLLQECVPVVLVSRSYGDDIDAVIVDNVKAAYEAIGHLIKTGHRKIAIALGRRELPIYADRLKGYRTMLEDSGLPFDESLIICETTGNSSFYSLTMDMLKSGIIPDAIFATSDPKAFVIMRALHDAGLRIPNDISVMGMDNVEMSSLIEPPLSTVSQPLYEMGKLAAQKLFRQIANKDCTGKMAPPRIDVLPTELIIRKSTK